MSEFRGFRCDGCQAIIEDPAERTKQRIRFESGVGEFEDYFQDLCPECTSDVRRTVGATMKPVPQRRRRTRLVNTAA